MHTKSYTTSLVTLERTECYRSFSGSKVFKAFRLKSDLFVLFLKLNVVFLISFQDCVSSIPLFTDSIYRTPNKLRIQLVFKEQQTPHERHTGKYKATSVYPPKYASEIKMAMTVTLTPDAYSARETLGRLIHVSLNARASVVQSSQWLTHSCRAAFMIRWTHFWKKWKLVILYWQGSIYSYFVQLTWCHISIMSSAKCLILVRTVLRGIF